MQTRHREHDSYPLVMYNVKSFVTA